MATIKLKSTPVPPGQRRTPLRGAGVQARPTLAQAQAQRAQRQGPPAAPKPIDPRPAPSVPQYKPAHAAPTRPDAARVAPPKPAETRRPTSAVTPATTPAGTPAASSTPAVTHPADAVRLSKRLTELKLASRREADSWIEAGWVRVNGRAAVLGQRVQPGDTIDIEPIARELQARKLTVLLHKPIGFVSGQAEDGYEPAVVLVTPDNRWADDGNRRPVPGSAPPPGLAPAGRLDIDSTGLLVLTQDGRIARHLIGEHSDVEKEYLVRVEAMPTLREDAIALLGHGLELDGVMLRPARISWANEDQLRIVLREGRKRQIRRMCELVGYKVVGLKRVRIGSVVLGKLPLGQWRLLRDDERF